MRLRCWKIKNDTDMNELMINEEKMTSLQIAEVTGKRHDAVLRDIRNILSQGVDAHNFVETSYIDKANRQQKCFELSKKGCLILASGYDALLREKIINRWEELEVKEQNKFAIPQTYADALMLAANQAKQIEEQQKTIKANAEEIVALSDTITKMQPKVSYYDKILASTATLTVTQVAQDYGMSAKAFNILLRNFGIQHKVNGQWILYAKYLQQGYVHSRSVDIVRRDGRHDTKSNTEWLQKGRLFLYEELKKHNVLPLVEQNQQ